MLKVNERIKNEARIIVKNLKNIKNKIVIIYDFYMFSNLFVQNLIHRPVQTTHLPLLKSHPELHAGVEKKPSQHLPPALRHFPYVVVC